MCWVLLRQLYRLRLGLGKNSHNVDVEGKSLGWGLINLLTYYCRSNLGSIISTATETLSCGTMWGARKMGYQCPDLTSSVRSRLGFGGVGRPDLQPTISN